MGVYNSDTTLGDLNRLDRDNFGHVMKKDAVTYQFKTHKAAILFMGQCVQTCITKCGVTILPGMSGQQIQDKMDKKAVKVEHREYPPEEPLYQTGLYIYSEREIAGFVSSPFKYSSQLFLPDHYCVRTTVKMPQIILTDAIETPEKEM